MSPRSSVHGGAGMARLGVALLFVLVACRPPVVRPGGTRPTPPTAVIQLAPDGWAPREVYVRVGDRVAIVNSSGAREGVGVTGPGAAGPLVRHQILLPGDGMDVTLTEPGEFAVRRDEQPEPSRFYEYVRIFVSHRQ